MSQTKLTDIERRIKSYGVTVASSKDLKTLDDSNDRSYKMHVSIGVLKDLRKNHYKGKGHEMEMG